MLLVSSCVPVISWLCSRVMRFQSRTINWPLLTIESPVAQWLEHPTRSRRVVGSNPIWGSDFFRVLQTFNLSCFWIMFLICGLSTWRLMLILTSTLELWPLLLPFTLDFSHVMTVLRCAQVCCLWLTNELMIEYKVLKFLHFSTSRCHCLWEQ